MDSEAIDKRGKFHNRISDDDINRGGKGKLNAQQLQERAELHASRFVQGYPTVNAICQHWWDNYQIRMHPRSEKEWAATPSNKQWIENVAEEWVAKGKLQYPVPTIQSVTNTLTTGAKANADVIVVARAKIKNLLLDFDKVEIKEKKQASTILKDLSKVVKDHSDTLLDMLKFATDVNYKQNVWEAELQRKKRLSERHDKDEEGDGTRKPATDISNVLPVEKIESMRKKAGIDE